MFLSARQSALLKYWQFEPMSAEDRARVEREKKKNHDQNKEQEADKARNGEASGARRTTSDAKVKEGAVPKPEKGVDGKDLMSTRALNEHEQDQDKRNPNQQEVDEAKPKPPVKKIPVLFLDEAHKVRHGGKVPWMRLIVELTFLGSFLR